MLCVIVKLECGSTFLPDITKPPVNTERGVDQGVRLKQQNQDRRHAKRHQRRTPQESSPSHELLSVHATDGACGCAALPTQRIDQAHTQQGAERVWNQTTWCTTMAQNEHDDRARKRAGMSNGSGYDRSSAQLVTALCPTRLQNCATGTGAHTVSKAMFTKLAAIIWLKGALHGASNWEKLWTRARLCDEFLPQWDETNIVNRLTALRPIPPRTTKFGISTSPATVIYRSKTPHHLSTPCGLCCG